MGVASMPQALVFSALANGLCLTGKFDRFHDFLNRQCARQFDFSCQNAIECLLALEPRQPGKRSGHRTATELRLQCLRRSPADGRQRILVDSGRCRLYHQTECLQFFHFDFQAPNLSSAECFTASQCRLIRFAEQLNVVALDPLGVDLGDYLYQAPVRSRSARCSFLCLLCV